MNGAAFAICGGGITGPDGPLLRDLTFAIPETGVTAILGPAGCGKTKLLQALAVRLDGGWRAEGGWTRRESVYFPQSRVKGNWRAAFDRPDVPLLLDEIDRAVAREERIELASRILEHARETAVVLVTHDLAFAQALADAAFLLCAGTLVEGGPARELFQHPQHELTRRFLLQGNCWPAAPSPGLPSHFHWIMPGKLAGMGRPGLLRDEDDDLVSIAANGISLLVSLTERPFPRERLRSFGIASRHFPIVDMGVPALAPTARLCGEMEKRIKGGVGVAVHCHAGLGRTGTVLAALLIWQHQSAADAIARVRGIIDGAIQSPAQMAFLREFEGFV